MKNRQTTILLCLTILFLGFTVGFLAGRTTASGDVIITTRIPETVPSSRVLPVATEESSSKDPTASQSGQADSGLININTANVSQLTTLPGIGPVLAQRIIDYREANGPFRSIAQLTLVEGIGESRLEALLGLITTE